MILLVLIIWTGWQLIKGLVYNSKDKDKTRPFSIFGTTNRGTSHHQENSMGLFDRFKKKEEPHYDPSNLQIKDLRVGFMFDYDMKTWAIKEEYEYDWGRQLFY